jgi:hypothetical protein
MVGSGGGPRACRSTRTMRPSSGCRGVWPEGGLVTGERVGVDASRMEAKAALRATVRRGGEGYREILTRLVKESGIETPPADDLMRPLAR